jgi:uncharacterized membrane protein
MIRNVVTALLWFSALGCGLLAGLYFSFSTFIMNALAQVGQASGVAAMNAINSTIQRSLFMPIFLGTSLASLALAVLGAVRWSEPAAWMLVVGGLLYFFGMFVVTMVFNVPLNNALAAANATDPQTAALWARYLKDWTFWNHVRTITSLAASALFIAAIASR